MSKLNALKIKRSQIANLEAKEQLQKMIDEIVVNSVKSETRRLIIAMNILEAFQRNKLLGHGKTRLLRYIEDSEELQRKIYERYEDADLFAMEKYLKEEVGIDVRDIFERRFAEEDRHTSST